MPTILLTVALAATAAVAGVRPPAEYVPSRSVAPSAAGVWTGWISSPTNPARRLLPIKPSTAAPTSTLVIDPSARYQKWRGVGAGLTDASVELMNSSAAARTLLFDPAAAIGARLNLVRLSSTDFSRRAWAWGWDGSTAQPTPEAMVAADLVVDRLLPLRPGLSVVGTPWTAPAELKDSNSLRGGWLKDDAEASGLEQQPNGQWR